MVEFRDYVLENDSIHLFTQFGLGYGRLAGTIEENGRVSFSGDAVGMTIGIGADVCSESQHCFTVESMYRRLRFDRVVAQKTEGAFDTAGGSLSQYGRKREVELDNHDLAVDLGGLIFQLGYAYKF